MRTASVSVKLAFLLASWPSLVHVDVGGLDLLLVSLPYSLSGPNCVLAGECAPGQVMLAMRMASGEGCLAVWGGMHGLASASAVASPNTRT